MIKLNSYFKTNAILHLVPNGAILINPKINMQRYSNIYRRIDIIPDKKRFFLMEANASGSALLSALDGTKRVGEVMEHLWGKDYIKYTKDVVSFLEAVYNRFGGSISDHPIKKTLQTTGSREYYWPVALQVDSSLFYSINKKDLLKILAEFRSHGTIHIEFTGGEPFLHPDLLKILDWSAKRFYTMVLATNGWFINEHVAKELAKYSNLIVQVSLDSSTPDYHDKLRGKKGAWKKAVEAIYNLTSQGVATRVEMTVTPENVNEIEDVIQLALELGTNSFVSAINNVLDPKAYVQMCKQINEPILVWKDKARGYMDIFEKRETCTPLFQPCGAGKVFWALTDKLRLKPCFMVPDQVHLKIEKENKKFKNPFKDKKAELISSIPTTPNKKICLNCKYLPYCDNCLARGINMYYQIGSECTWGKKFFGQHEREIFDL